MARKKTTKRTAHTKAVAATLVPSEVIEGKILMLRGEKVMVDEHLAELYDVSIGHLVQAVKRNLARFPEDFMFQMSSDEWDVLKSQNVISKRQGRGGRRTPPYCFTEHGILMLSSVLRSERAVQVNIEIIRTFVRLREMLSSHKNLARKLDDLEKKYDHQFKMVFDAIRQLMASPEKPRRQIGFHVGGS